MRVEDEQAKEFDRCSGLLPPQFLEAGRVRGDFKHPLNTVGSGHNVHTGTGGARPLVGSGTAGTVSGDAPQKLGRNRGDLPYTIRRGEGQKWNSRMTAFGSFFRNAN